MITEDVNVVAGWEGEREKCLPYIVIALVPTSIIKFFN